MAPKRQNQHESLPDDEDFCAKIKEYYLMGITDTKMAPLLQGDFKLFKAPSTKTIQRRRQILGLKSSNQLKATFEILEPCITEIRERFPTMGQRQMRSLLLQDYAMKVNEKTIGQFLKLKEPERVQIRQRRKFRRKQFEELGNP